VLMKKSNYHNARSFLGKTRIVLVLLGILPFLLVVYLFFYEKIDLTDMIVVFSGLALFSILSGFYIMRSFSDQLVALAEQTAKINSGEQSGPVLVESDQELIDISAHFNSVISKLEHANKHLKEQSVLLMTYARDLSVSYKKAKSEEELRNRLSQYVASHLVDRLIDAGDGMLFENEIKEVTILFADIRSFTTITEGMQPEAVVSMLNQFFSTMVDIVFQNNGILDKFVGDQLMAVFGAISSDRTASVGAVQAALEMQSALEDMMKLRAQKKKKIFTVGVGINTGNAIICNVGSENRMDYTVIGNCVNIAAGLEDNAKGGEIIIGEKTYHQTQHQFSMQPKDDAYIKNKIEPVKCYRVLKAY